MTWPRSMGCCTSGGTLAHAEQTAPGAYFRLLAKAAHITSTGQNPDTAPLDDMQDVIRQRLGR